MAAQDPYRYFRVEAHELQDELGRGVLALEKGEAASQVLASLLRVAHTLKGAARVVKQREIAEQSHAIEEALTPFRDSAAAVPRAAIEAALRALDEIALRIASLDTPAPITPAKADALVKATPEALAQDPDEIHTLLDGLTAAGTLVSSLRRGADTLRRAHSLALQITEHDPHVRSRHDAGATSVANQIATLQSDIGIGARQVSDGIEQLERELADARESAERLRLVPAGRMFVALERAARDAALQLGKTIEFLTTGAHIRLDAQAFAVIQAALVQAVRNAVAHGIEDPDVRSATGKAPRGRISIEVRRRGHQVAISCQDDGRGVDLDAVRKAAERRGMSSEEARALDSPRVLQLLLEGGLSTSSTVTQLAGRGIGLDLVRDAAARLHGTADIRTDPGLGTRIEMIVPMSLAAVDALLVESAGRTVGIPLEAVRRTLRVAPADLAPSAQGASLLFEGQLIPFVPLERALQSGTTRRHAGRTWSALVIQGATALAAVGVERLRGKQNLVVRPLPAFTPCSPVVAGASLDAAGNPQLVLDPEALVERLTLVQLGREDSAAGRTPILVIDDSLTTRMLEQSILESAGYEVDLAVSGEEALQRALARRYALFLVDVEMPGMDGFTFIERARSDPALRDIPAVLVTSLASPEHRRRGQEVGARGHIAKGAFDQSELLRTIRSLVGT